MNFCSFPACLGLAVGPERVAPAQSPPKSGGKKSGLSRIADIAQVVGTAVALMALFYQVHGLQETAERTQEVILAGQSSINPPASGETANPMVLTGFSPWQGGFTYVVVSWGGRDFVQPGAIKRSSVGQWAATIWLGDASTAPGTRFTLHLVHVTRLLNPGEQVLPASAVYSAPIILRKA